MPHRASPLVLASVLVTLTAASSGALAEPAGTVKASLKQPTSSAELGFGAAVVGKGGDLAITFQGPVFTLQAGHWRPIVAVVHAGMGAALDEAPDTGESRANEAFLLALGARVRPLAFRNPAGGRMDLFVGPLATVIGNHQAVTVGVGAEVGVALLLGRWRLSLQAQAGWSSILSQEVVDRLQASWIAGGSLAFGRTF
jgi:hypothetical protein